MNVIISSKNFDANDRLVSTLEGKLSKLDKYFSKDTNANVTIRTERGRQTLEATIDVGGTLFRAQDTSTDIYNCIDVVVNKLSSQMSRFKTKLLKKHKDTRIADFAALPDADDNVDTEIRISKHKKFTLNPMAPEEAILQMELLNHDFYVFLNMETDDIGIVYKRLRGDYGLLETEV